MQNWTSIDHYISSFPEETQKRLEVIRKIILKNVPDATETISYNMPAFRLDKILLYFAAYKKHIGLYPSGTAIVHFKEQLSDLKTSKGAIQFPLDKPLPVELIKKIVLFRAKENRNNPKKK